MEIRTIKNQSLFDIAVQEGGSAASVFFLAVQNNLSLTDALEAGQVLATADILDADIVSYYRSKGLKPVTTDDVPNKLGGIGYMGIEIDFIVS